MHRSSSNCSPHARRHFDSSLFFPSLRRPLSVLVPLIASLAYASVQAAPPLPSGGNFVAGSGSIGGGGQSLNVNQTSTRGVIDWNSFSIGAGRQVNINNGSGATLNRVTGGDASVIMGQLNASGSVYLINPQGVLVGPGGVVSTGGRFVASALDVNNAAFMNGGPLALSGGGNGMIVNLGKIGSSGGDVILVSRSSVVNAGRISAPNGTAELATGDQVLLQDVSGSQQVFVQTGSKGTVMNAGAINAAQASLQAADGNVFALAGNSAAIRATGTATRDGHVWLVADQGAVHANGNIAAANANGAGGTVETRASTLDVSSANVQAANWKLGAPAFTMNGATSNAVSRSLANGTNVDAEASSGDLTVTSNVQWNGNGSLTLGAAHDVKVASNTKIGNKGAGSLTLRADAAGADNGGSIVNAGTIDWSKSTGMVSALYDMTGTYSPGTLLSNASWKPAPYSGQVTQITAYKLVNNAADLQSVAQNLGGNYALGRDIDASGIASYQAIGLTNASPFAGQFDGFGHSVTGLAVTGTDTMRDVGLFGVIGAGGVVRNMNVSGSATGFGGYTYGVLAGDNYGTVAYVNTSGRAGDLGFGGLEGGLVGYNHGVIERSSSSADVSIAGGAGGLVGRNAGTIAQSFATGEVRGNSHGETAGLVAFNDGLITQSYSTGVPISTQGEGSLVFQNSATGVIDESFAIGGPIGGGGPPAPFGGIASTNQGTINANVYWDKEKTGQSHAAGANTGTVPPDSNALTTAQMSSADSFKGWNFGAGGTWAIPAGGDHPVLQWQQAQP